MNSHIERTIVVNYEPKMRARKWRCVVGSSIHGWIDFSRCVMVMDASRCWYPMNWSTASAWTIWASRAYWKWTAPWYCGHRKCSIRTWKRVKLKSNSPDCRYWMRPKIARPCRCEPLRVPMSPYEWNTDTSIYASSICNTIYVQDPMCWWKCENTWSIKSDSLKLKRQHYSDARLG